MTIDPVKDFRGEHAFLSNFWRAEITYCRRQYGSSEHLYQALKAVRPEDHENIRLAASPAVAKKMGRTVQQLPDWERRRDQAMEMVVRLKFRQHPDLAAKLLATGNRRLIEGNRWHDYYWGADLDTGAGKNKLGIILMKVRAELQSLGEVL
jgi:ribA/ribD-fused uncharacterized protein